MVGRLLELKRAVNKHKEEKNLELMLTAVDKAVLAVVLPIPEPFIHAQTLLEGAK